MAGKASGAYSKKLPEGDRIYLIDFFCGSGGMSHGFLKTRQSHLRFEILGGIDINDDALATYAKNIGVPGLNCDVRSLAEHPAKLAELFPEIESLRPLVFVGCPPCQGFSALRKGDNRDDHRNDLSLAFAKLVDQYRPDAIVMENVPEVLSGKFAYYFSRATAILRRAGYTLHADVMDLSQFGVPQRRRRAVLVGSLSGQLQLPVPTLAGRPPTVRDAIGHLAPVEAGAVDEFDPHHRAPAHTSRLLEVFKQIPPDGGDRRALPEHLQLASHRKLDSGRTPGFTDVYGRLRWDSPSVTITAKSRSPSSGRFLHPEQHRNISVREAALLQGFPHNYRFCGTPTQQYRQIGEAVPPLFARSVAWAVLESFRTRPTVEPIPRNLRTPPIWKEADHGLRSVDLFCGAGGLSLGFRVAGFRSLLGCDSDAAAVATYERNLDRAVVADIGSAEFRDLLAAAVDGQPFVAVGGPPCQGFSHQRRGHAHDPRNELVLTYADVLLALDNRPKAIVLENVTDLDLPRGKHVLSAYLDKLRGAGYDCFRHDINSAEFGVPQLRRRIIVVALPSEIAAYYAGPISLNPLRWLSVGEALAGLPEPVSPGEIPTIPNHFVAAEGLQSRRRIAFVDMGEGRKAIPPALQLPCHASNYRGHRDVFGRLDWFSQARTLTSGFDSFTRGEYGHPFRHRSITPREAARIQGFPDWFEFLGTKAEVRRQIGNAVPPPLAFAIATAVSSAFEQAGDVRWAA